MKKVIIGIGIFLSALTAQIAGMDELPPVPTQQELHSQAVSEGIGVTFPVFLLALPVTALAQYVVTLPGGTASWAAGIAALEGARTYYTVRYPTPTIIKWKQLIALRPKVINTIHDVQRDFDRYSSQAPNTICPQLGLPHYMKFYSNKQDADYLLARGLNLPDVSGELSNLIALCMPYSDQKVPASALALYLAKRKRTLEGYRDAMITLAPYALPSSGPLLSDPMPKISKWNDIMANFGNPEGIEGIITTQATMRSCNKAIGILGNKILALREAMGA